MKWKAETISRRASHGEVRSLGGLFLCRVNLHAEAESSQGICTTYEWKSGQELEQFEPSRVDGR